jgi:hypothetical protein
VQQHYTHTQFNVNSLLSGKTSAPVKIDEIMAIKGQIPALSYIFAVFHQVQVLRRFPSRGSTFARAAADRQVKHSP